VRGSITDGMFTLAASQVTNGEASVIIDLQDDRRGDKPWLSTDDRGVTGGLVIEDEHGKPACVRHGAMNRVDPTAGSIAARRCTAALAPR
jgi:hypothetical protein